MHVKKSRSGAALIIAMILLSCCAASGLWLAAQKVKADGWVRHTFEVKDHLSRVRISMLRAEVYRRSYLLGDAQARTTLMAIRRDLPSELRMLRSMTADNRAQHARMSALERLASARLAEVDAAVLLHDRGRGAEAAATMASEASHRATAALIGLIGEIGANEQRLLAQRLKQAENLGRPIQWGLISTGLLILLLGFLVYRARREQIAALRTANDELQADIARRERAESELALLAANATDAVLRIGLDGCCIYASPSVEQVLGFEARQMVGQPLGGALSSPDHEAILAFHQSLVSGRLERGVLTYRVERPDDPSREVWIEAHSGLVRDAAAEPREVIASLRDVTERKMLELELEAARSRAEAAARAKSSFLANMSHEIRTPMNGVLGFADLLLNSNISPEQRHHAQLIADSGKAMMRLLNDILDLSKIEAGQMQTSPEALDLRHALRNCIKLMQPAAAQKGLQLDIEIDDALPECIMLDGLRLRQITLNLLANAVKFTAVGRVRLHAFVTGPAGSTFAVSVEDSGIGIPHDRQAAVFEQFIQAEYSTAKRFGGTGLGLAISKQLASLMGGSLDLTSEEGIGTTFCLRLPLIEAKSAKTAQMAEAASALADRPLRVLLAEDHDVNQALMCAMLSRLGHNSVVVEDGLQAVKAVEAGRLKGSPFDLLLMDMQMPVMDGVEATRKIRAMGVTAAELPILALTANAYADDVAACLSAGMQAHLAKPIELASLAAAIQKWTVARPREVIVVPAFTISPALKARFDARKAELAALAKRLTTSKQLDEDQVAQLAGMLHKLAGSAAMFAQEPLGLRAAELEARLEAASGDRGAIVHEVLKSLQDVA